MSSIRWTNAVSLETEEAVRAHILELTADQAKTANAQIGEDDLVAIVEEAVQWARDR